MFSQLVLVQLCETGELLLINTEGSDHDDDDDDVILVLMTMTSLILRLTPGGTPRLHTADITALMTSWFGYSDPLGSV